VQFTVKLFPEITIKSRPVRQRMVGQLRDNLHKLLRPVDPAVRVTRDWDRIVIETDAREARQHQQIIDILQCTPGISNFLQVVDYPWQGMEDAFEKTRALFADQLENKTFAVRCKRTGRHTFTSTEVEYQVGGLLKEHCPNAGVKLTNPDVMIRLEVRDDRFSVVLKRYEGLGGFPLGSQDAVLSLISGGFDSTVASYLTMKRGLLTHFCFFNLGGRAHERGVKEVAVYLWMKYGASHPVMFITVPFEEVVKEILEKIENSQMGVILKRMMLRAATRKAEDMDIVALVTGESVAQVSSQTLQNLSVIDRVTDTLVLRPLVTMDKTDIIDVARRIGTEKFAETMPEYCGVISVKPTTRARMERILAEEGLFNFSVLETAIMQARKVRIDQIVRDVESNNTVEILQNLQAGHQVIDIRHPDEEEKRPLQLEHHTITHIPFYKLSSEFQQLDQQQTWLLYCEKGVMSQLHAQYLKEEGFSNVKVYRPVKSDSADNFLKA
jgi:thiamine biosynthesis protein ThiI